MRDEIRFGTYEGQPPRYHGLKTHSVYIPMRDGVRLAASITLPRDLEPGTRLPVLLSLTRYWRTIELRAPLRWFLRSEALNPYFRDFQPFFSGRGYALVAVDQRGTGASFGVWPHPWCDASVEDARVVVDWIVAQDWCDGRVGAWGISYVGTTAELLAVLNHPAVKAVLPMFNHPDPYSDIAFPGGLFDERFIKAWGYFDQILDRNVIPPDFGPLSRLLMTGVRPVDGDRGRHLLKAAVAEHAANGNAYTLASAAESRDDRQAGMSVDGVAVHRFAPQLAGSPTLTCGWASWLDAGTADAALRRFLTFDNARLAVIGAWEHGGRFNASPYRPPEAPASPPLPAQWREMLRFLDATVKGLDTGLPPGTVDRAAGAGKTLFYYTLGEEAWKSTPVWPPAGTAPQRWYLAADGALSSGRPGAVSGADPYTVDFEATTGDYNRWWEMGVLEYKTVSYGDRAEADRRLLTYTSAPLQDDLEIAGYPVVTLYVSSTATDGAFFVYLEDVDENGRVFYVTEGQLRAAHRWVAAGPSPYNLQVPYHTFCRADMQPLVPGEVAELSFGLHPTSVLIRRGHRLRVAIAGHDKGTFRRVPAEGTPAITVARNSVHASYVDLPVAPRP